MALDRVKKDNSRLLYKSLDVVNDKSTIIANQFIVRADNEKEEFTVYSHSNPRDYREFTLPFSYLKGVGTIDGDGNFLKITTHREKTVNRKLAEYADWKAWRK